MGDDLSDIIPGGVNATGQTASGYTDSSGMVISDPAPAAPSNVDMNDPDTTSSTKTTAPGGFMSSLENFGASVVNKTEGAVSTVYGGVKTAAGDVITGAEGVAQKGANIVTGTATTLTMNIVIVLVVIGVALVLVARSGAIKVSA